MSPIILPLGRNSAGTASQYITYALMVWATLATPAATEWQWMCCQMWPDSPPQRVLRAAGEASRRRPKGSSLWFPSWDVRSDRHINRFWLVSCSCSFHLWCSSSDLVELHSWYCCKQLCTAGHQVSACKICVKVVLPSAKCIQKEVCRSWAKFLRDVDRFFCALNTVVNPSVCAEVSKICKQALYCFSLSTRIFSLIAFSVLLCKNEGLEIFYDYGAVFSSA